MAPAFGVVKSVENMYGAVASRRRGEMIQPVVGPEGKVPTAHFVVPCY